MKFPVETVADAHKTTLAATGAFVENVMTVTERLMKLNIEVTRIAFEKSVEITQEFLNVSLAKENLPPKSFLNLGRK